MTDEPTRSDRIEFSDGTAMTVLERPAGPTDPLVMLFELEHQCGAPPSHVHPTAAETFEVQEGAFEILVDGSWRDVAAGDSVTVPAGEPHTFRNESGSRVIIRNTHDPHHDFEAYIRSVAKLAEGSDPANPDRKMMVGMAMLWRRHWDLIRPSDPKLRIGMSVASLVGRIRGVSLPS